MNIRKVYSVVAAFLLSLGMASGAHAVAFNIGVLTEGGQNYASLNVDHYVSEHPGTSVTGMDNTTFNSMSAAALASTYDALIMPWYVSTSANLDWATRILPYMQAGGGVLWEDPNNIGDLAGSGITFGSTAGYTSDITLVPPFDANGAVGYYHTHFGITAATVDWAVWSTDGGGNIHGVYGEFGTNGGRMVLGVSDNLYHPQMWLPGESDHYNLLVNELAWLGTGSVTGDPTDPPCRTGCSVPEPGTLLLVGLGLAGFATRRKKGCVKG